VPSGVDVVIDVIVGRMPSMAMLFRSAIFWPEGIRGVTLTPAASLRVAPEPRAMEIAVKFPGVKSPVITGNVRVATAYVPEVSISDDVKLTTLFIDPFTSFRVTSRVPPARLMIFLLKCTWMLSDWPMP